MISGPVTRSIIAGPRWPIIPVVDPRTHVLRYRSRDYRRSLRPPTGARLDNPTTAEV